MTAAVSPTQTQAEPAAPITEAISDAASPEAAEIARVLAEQQEAEAAPAAAKPKDEPGTEADAVEEPAPDAKADKLAAAAKTIKRAKEAAKRSREADARAERERLRADHIAQQLAAERKETARAREEREAFKKDPLSAIKQAGVTARALAERAIAEGTPEAKIAAMEAAFEERMAKATAEMERKFNETLSSRDQQAAQAKFFGMIKPDTHPALTRLEDNGLVLLMAQHEFAKAQKNGHTPTDEQVLDWIESKLTSPQSDVAAPTKPKTNPTGATAVQTVAKPAPTSRTVTADLSTRRYTLPANFDDLDDYDQREALVKMAEANASRDS